MTAARPLRPTSGRVLRLTAVAALSSLLLACATPSAPVSKTVYDFGSPALPAAARAAAPQASPLALADMQTPAGPSGTAMQYRLAYANPHELMAYTLARWSQPPGSLVAQRVRAVLSQQRPIVALGEGAAAHLLQLSLESFDQSFDSPTSSHGTLQLRATLFKGEQLLAQRDFIARAPAPTPDAPGGVQALSLATETVAAELASWVADNAR